MELLLLLLLSAPLFLFLSLKWLNSKCRDSNSKLLLPPGQMGWPFLGETLEFMSTGKKGVQEKFFNDRMNRHSSEIFKTSLIAEKTAVFCGAAGNKFLFSNESKLVKVWYPRNVAKIFPTSLKVSPTEETIKMRKFLPGYLQLREYVATMDAITRQQLDAHWDSDDEITILPLAKNLSFAVACRLFLSVDDPDQIARLEKPFHAVMVGVFSLPVNLPWTRFNRGIKAASLIRKEVMEIIRRRKCEAKTADAGGGRQVDILDHMLQTIHMPDADIADNIIAILMAGHDTTSTVITFIVKYLAELPHVYDNVLKEQREIAEEKKGEILNWDDLQKMTYSWSVACEAMRLAPPIPGSFREALADFTYAGFSIPKGWKLYWTSNSTHKNPDYFEEPEKFDPSRFEGRWPVPYSYVPFGGGTRLCPGKEYARIQILVFMHILVTNFRWEKVIPNEKIVVELMPMPANGLPVRMHRT